MKDITEKRIKKTKFNKNKNNLNEYYNLEIHMFFLYFLNYYNL